MATINSKLLSLEELLEQRGVAEDEEHTSPSLEELLEQRGITKNEEYGDYQDYIEDQQAKGIKSGFLNLQQVPLTGSMHLVLRQVINVSNFWKREDKQ